LGYLPQKLVAKVMEAARVPQLPPESEPVNADPDAVPQLETPAEE
ncbi:MAG: hypothetical protein RLZZ444_2648, partial [Pseudomonadota bacterium]